MKKLYEDQLLNITGASDLTLIRKEERVLLPHPIDHGSVTTGGIPHHELVAIEKDFGFKPLPIPKHHDLLPVPASM